MTESALRKAAKSILILSRTAPHGSAVAQECLDLVLATAAFAQRVHVLFMDDGVFQLLKDQDTRGIGRKNIAQTLPLLGLYELAGIYADCESLRARGIDAENLAIPVEQLDTAAIRRLMQSCDLLLGC